MSWENVYTDDFGWVGKLVLKQRIKPDEPPTIVDISTYLTKEFFFLSPAGVALEAKSAQFFTDGSDGILFYKTESGVIDMPGNWLVTARITKADARITSDPHSFNVSDIYS